MILFGIIYSIGEIIAGFIGKAGGYYVDTVQKERAIKQKLPTYFDSQGKQRWAENGRIVKYEIRDGNQVYYDAETGKIYKNITEERKQKREDELDRLNIKYVSINKPYNELSEQELVIYKHASSSFVYRNRIDQKLYQTVYINDMKFYMDLQTGYIKEAAETFEELFKRRDKNKYYKHYCKFSIEQMIAIVNKYQSNQLKKNDINTALGKISVFRNTFYILENKKVSVTYK